jgi:hypothetical protein
MIVPVSGLGAFLLGHDHLERVPKERGQKSWQLLVNNAMRISRLVIFGLLPQDLEMTAAVTDVSGFTGQ